MELERYKIFYKERLYLEVEHYTFYEILNDKF